MCVHRHGGLDGGGCELGMVANHLHKGQGSVPGGGRGWHEASKTGRERQTVRETDRVRDREGEMKRL